MRKKGEGGNWSKLTTKGGGGGTVFFHQATIRKQAETSCSQRGTKYTPQLMKTGPLKKKVDIRGQKGDNNKTNNLKFARRGRSEGEVAIF